MLNRRNFLKISALGTAASVLNLSCAAVKIGKTSSRPNILLIIGDDMCWFDCQPYGSTQVKTPHLQRLADEGMCLDAMFTATAMCAPTRQQLYTGLFPVRNGAYPNHSRVYEGVKSLPHYLQSLGYRVGLIGKKHYLPPSAFPFEYFGGLDHDTGKGQDITVEDAFEFMTRSGDQPYCLVVASNQPHSPWTRKPKTIHYNPKSLTVPPHLVDCPKTRQGLVAYYAEISYLDETVGQCLEMVKQTGKADNTLTLFTSEQGDGGFPFGGKWTCYDTGLKTATILRWPNIIKPGVRSDAMVQYVDVVPTLIEIAGGDPTQIDTGRADANGNTGFDGRSFLQVLRGSTDQFHEYVYGVQTTRGIHWGSACYPIRSVRSKRYKYIRNLNHKATFHSKVCRREYMQAWQKAARDDPSIAARLAFYQHRPAEELYDLQTDPWELNNRADDPALSKVKENLQQALAKWMQQQGDDGIGTEMQATERQGLTGDPNWKSYDQRTRNK